MKMICQGENHQQAIMNQLSGGTTAAPWILVPRLSYNHPRHFHQSTPIMEMRRFPCIPPRSPT